MWLHFALGLRGFLVLIEGGNVCTEGSDVLESLDGSPRCILPLLAAAEGTRSVWGLVCMSVGSSPNLARKLHSESWYGAPVSQTQQLKLSSCHSGGPGLAGLSWGPRSWMSGSLCRVSWLSSDMYILLPSECKLPFTLWNALRDWPRINRVASSSPERC